MEGLKETYPPRLAKNQFISTGKYGVTSQEKARFIVAAVRTSNPA
jgi:hypothetical protein